MRIIIADDSAFVRRIMIKMLKTNFKGIEIIACPSGKEALEAFSQKPTEWMIVDLLMPVMTGQELIENIKEKFDMPKIIVASADIQKATRDELYEMGIVKFINKPLTAEKLKAIVDTIRGV